MLGVFSVVCVAAAHGLAAITWLSMPINHVPYWVQPAYGQGN